MTSSHPSWQPDRLARSFQPQYAQDPSWLDRLRQPGVLATVVLVLLTIVYQYLRPVLLSGPPGELLWDLLVSASPGKVVHAIDEWFHPPMFPAPNVVRPALPATHAAKSEALQRIFGMDKPDGIINSVAQAGRRSISHLSGNSLIKKNDRRPPGLGNYDNSCFQNSILQGLSSLKPLPRYLEKASLHDQAENTTSDSSAASLRGLISRLTDASNNGTTLWTPRKLRSLDTWEQQDAQEYFSKILDEIEKEVAVAAKSQHKSFGFESVGARDDSETSQHSDDSGYQSLSVLSKAGSDARIPRNPLEGLAAQRVACVRCGHSEGLSMIPFNCLTLNLGVGQSAHDLYERLDSYTHLEAIEGVECAKCTLLKVQRLLRILVSRGQELGTVGDARSEPLSRLEAVDIALDEDDFEEKTLTEKCKISAPHRVSSTKTKQAVIARPPQSLAIHMNRSVFDEATGHMFKNMAAVRFPKTLDLGPWCLGSADAGLNSGPKGEEQWLMDPRSSMVAGDQEPSKITGPIYELRAVVTHQGRHENGHYVCYRKHPTRPSKLEDSSGYECESTGDDDEESHTDANNDDEARDLPSASKWWRLSDESVWEVSEDVVLAQGGVFMLFYDCVDPNSVLISDINSKKSQDGNEVTDDLDEATPERDGLRLAPSHLIPELSDGETIDCTIPCKWPNR